MKNFFDRKKTSDSPGTNSDVMTQIGKIKNQLDSLERKIDSLLDQSGPSQSGRNRFPQKGKGNRGHGFGGNNLTQATCSECGSVCEIPFKPTGNRPVYCSDCFSKRKRGTSFTSNHFSKPKKSGFDRFFKKNRSNRN